MNYGTLVPSFYFYKFAESVSQPYTSFMAYRSGAIDANGNLLKPESSIDPFEYFVIKLKRIFDQLPPGLTKYELSNYASTLNMFAEEAEQFNIEKDHFVALVEGWIAVNLNPEASYIELLEDMSAGGMATPASSDGYNTGAVSGFDPVMAPMQRRKPVADEQHHMFDVSEKDYANISQNGLRMVDYLRRFNIRNPSATVMIRNPKTNEIHIVSKKSKLNENTKTLLSDILEQNGAVKDYTDKQSDTDTNVAVLRNDQEKLGYKAAPLEVTQRNVDDTLEAALQAVRDQQKISQIAEKGVNLQDTLRSIKPIFRAARAGTSGEERAAHALGLLRHLAGRPTSSTEPFDSARAIYNPEAEGHLDVSYRDTKIPTASVKIPTRGMRGIEFPEVGGIPAPEAVAMLKSTGGSESERRRITTDVIKPFINQPEIRAALGNEMLRIHREKAERVSDPSKIVMPGELSVGIVKVPGKEPIEVDMPGFAKDLESSTWRFGVRRGGAKAPSFTPEVTGGKYSAYSGYGPQAEFVPDESDLRDVMGTKTGKSIRDYFLGLQNRS